MGQIKAPWTPEQVEALNLWQISGTFHPYTCPNGTDLTATGAGWVCSCCRYTQDWAHALSADKKALETHNAMLDDLFGWGKTNDEGETVDGGADPVP